MDTLCITGVRRSRSTGPEMRMADMPLERGISHVTVWRRLTRRHVCRREGIYGRVAYWIAAEVGGGETVWVVRGRGDADWHTGKDVLGRVGPGIRRVCRGGRDRV